MKKYTYYSGQYSTSDPHCPGYIYGMLGTKKEYTPIRKFYAWVGFITLIIAAVILLITMTGIFDKCKPNMSTAQGPAYANPKTGEVTTC